MQHKLSQRKPPGRFAVFPKSGRLRHGRKERQRKVASAKAVATACRFWMCETGRSFTGFFAGLAKERSMRHKRLRREPLKRFAVFSEKRMLAARQKGTPAESRLGECEHAGRSFTRCFWVLLRNGACGTSVCGGNRRSASLVFFRKAGACGTVERNAGGKLSQQVLPQSSSVSESVKPAGRSFTGFFAGLAKERSMRHKLPQRKPPGRLRHDGSSIGSLSPPSNSESANMPGVPWRTVLNGLLRNGACSATGYEEHPERRFPLLSGKQPL